MLTPRWYLDYDHGGAIAAGRYGGAASTQPSDAKGLLNRHLTTGARTGYLYQLLAGSV